MDQISDDSIKGINCFIGKNSYLFTRILCKQWDMGHHRNTKYIEAVRSISMLNEAIDNGIFKECDHVTLFNQAVLVGNIYVMKYFFRKYNHEKIHDTKTLGIAAGSGKLGNVKWLVDHVGCEMNENTFKCAASAGKLHVMKFLFERNCKIHDESVKDAISYGNLENVKWLWDKCNGICEDDTMDHVATCGNIEIMKWLISNTDMGVDTQTMTLVFCTGNVELLRYVYGELEDEICKIGYDGLYGTSGEFCWSMGAIRYLRSIGAEWGDISYQMFQYGTLEDIRWIFQNGFVSTLSSHDVRSCFTGAIDAVDKESVLDKIEFLCGIGHVTRPTIGWGAYHLNLDAMKLLKEKKCLWGKKNDMLGLMAFFMYHDGYSDNEKEILVWIKEECNPKPIYVVEEIQYME